jgi:transglutaminase-like putative cysteine protease
MYKPLRALIFSILSLVTTLISVATYAFNPSVNVSPKPGWLSTCKPYDQKPNLRTIESGYYYALIEQQVNIEKQATYRHIIKEIISGTGVQNASDISVSFNPSYQKLEFHSIIVWRDNKAENRLTASAFKMLAEEDDFSRFIYNGTYAAKYILNDIRKGDRIEYAYTITGDNPIFYNKFCRTVFLQDYTNAEHRYTSVLFSANRKLNTKSFNKAAAPVTSNVAGGLKRYEWEGFKVKGVENHKGQPAWYEEFARVQFTDYSSWAEVVDWGLKLNPVAADIKGGLRKEIEKLKKQSDGDQEVYFRDAVKFVQNEIRYMGIETGEYSHRANRPEKVFAQRYGDCKDKALLLVSMLEADEIEAHIALVATDLQEKIDDYLPSNTLFNHAIAVATINKKRVWVDATMSDQGGTRTNIYVPPYYRALILSSGNDKLSVIPPVDPGKVRCEEKYTVVNEKDPVSFDVKTIYTSGQADEIRGRLASASTAETEKNYLNYYLKIYPKIERKDSVTIIDDEKNNELTTIEHYKISNFFKQDSTTGKYTAGFYANAIEEQLSIAAEDIKTPVALSYPYHLEYTLAVTLPGGWNVESGHLNIDRDAYHFNKTVTIDTTTLIHYYELNYLKSYIPAEKLPEFRKDMKEITDNQLSFNFSYMPGNAKAAAFKINIWTMLIALLVVGLSIYFSIKIYCSNTQSLRLVNHSYGRSIGGWLVLITIGLGLTFFYNVYNLLSSDYFNSGIWNYYMGTQGFWYRGLWLFETAGNTFIVCYSAFCVVLMLTKRDILPKIIIGFYLFVIIFFLIDALWGYFFKGNISEHSSYNIIRAIIVAAIWVSYFRVSIRVKETFIVPYPHNNIVYEEDESNYDLE